MFIWNQCWNTASTIYLSPRPFGRCFIFYLLLRGWVSNCIFSPYFSTCCNASRIDICGFASQFTLKNVVRKNEKHFRTEGDSNKIVFNSILVSDMVCKWLNVNWVNILYFIFHAWVVCVSKREGQREWSSNPRQRLFQGNRKSWSNLIIWNKTYFNRIV